MEKQIYRIALFALAMLVGCVAANSQVRTDISGTYNVTGSSESGPRYEGELQIISQGEIYEFKWGVGDQYEGVGVINGNTVAVAWTSGTNGSGCGVVSYKVLANERCLGKLWICEHGNGESSKAKVGPAQTLTQ